jgi:small-conductance mechanosensitive channel
MIERIEDLTAGLPGWLNQTLLAVVIGLAAIALALIVHRIFFRLLKRVASSSESATDDLLVAKLGRPTRYALVALALILAAREAPALDHIWQKVAGFVMPALVGWMALAIMQALVGAMELHADISQHDNLRARRKRTRLAIFSRMASFLIVFVTVGLMLLSIPGVRDIGVTLMASAGLAGLAVGAAAQPALKSIIAGFQMAITEPINIDDVVIINGQWGRVEDIRTTYVIVRTWDERRLIVPTSKFLEDTFENWTRENAELLAPVLLYLDPLTEIGPLRAEFERQVKTHRLWDQRVAKLQVTDMTHDAIEVRLLMSAGDSAGAFDLRCDIRESVLAWVRDNLPDAVARSRVVSRAPAAVAEAAAATDG